MTSTKRKVRALVCAIALACLPIGPGKIRPGNAGHDESRGPARSIAPTDPARTGAQGPAAAQVQQKPTSPRPVNLPPSSFWIIFCVAAGGGCLLTLHYREGAHRRRRWALERAVSQRTQDLELERARETERNRILEMLVSNQSLGTVLDATVRLIRAQAPHASCAILLKVADGCRVGAAPDFPREWLTALRVPLALPFEVWRGPVQQREPAEHPAWKNFTSRLSVAPPSSIYSRPIGREGSVKGAVLLFYGPGVQSGERDAEAAEMGEHLAYLAIEHRRLCDDLHFQAHHDSLTRLPNRILFEERLERSLQEADVLGQRLALLFVDLDRFKEINDKLSHRIGDLFLCEIADRMKKAVRPGDTVARMGGDEFNVIVTDIRDEAEAREIATRIGEAIRQPLVIDGHELHPSASIGIGVYPDDAMDALELNRQADAAMYSAKSLGGNRVQTFNAPNQVLGRARMDEELRAALQNGYFALHYQPKTDANGRLAGLEALLRMNHPKYGQILPCEFIPVAEANGLMVSVGAWVLEEVCRQMAEWRAIGLSDVSVAINISPAQLSRPDFSKFLGGCLSRHGISPWNLELELSENLLGTASLQVHKQLESLRAMGVRLSIDNFGGGYSSLAVLQRLQIDEIKLHKSFTQSIDTDYPSRRLTQAMIGIAQSLGLNVVAEAVETESQRNALLASGCTLMQGFLFAGARSPAEIEEILRNHELPAKNETLPGHFDPTMGDLLDPLNPAAETAEAGWSNLQEMHRR